MTSLPTTMNDEVAAWVARMDGGNWTAQDEQDLQAWLAQDPARQGALLQAQAAWIAFDQLAVKPQAPVARPAAFPRRSLLLAGAGAVAASIAAAASFYFAPPRGRYTTVVGEVRHVPLSDGSFVTINTASDVEFQAQSHKRVAMLKAGEAWFEVAKDAARPFVVTAGDAFVQAVGTAFSVRRHAGGADVLVTEGIVDVWSAQQASSKVRLVVGQKASIGSNGEVEVSLSEPASADRVLAWRQGMIDLNGDPLLNAVGEFNRYNRRQLVLVDARLGMQQFDGTFRINDPEGFANAVKYTLNVPVDLSDPGEIRIGRP